MGLLELAPHGYSALGQNEQQAQSDYAVQYPKKQQEASLKIPLTAVPLGGDLAGDPDDGLQPDSGSSSDSESPARTPTKPSSSGPPTFGLLEFARFFGTGLLASVSYLDPGLSPEWQGQSSAHCT